MIEYNITPHKVDKDSYTLFITNKELTKLLDKHKQVLLKITKPKTYGTDSQNKAMHALLMEYYSTGMHSVPEGTFNDFKDYMKAQYGVFKEINIKGERYKLLKSWSDYNRDERRAFIDKLISEIHQSGAYNESVKIQEIINGMKNNGGKGCIKVNAFKSSIKKFLGCV